MLYETKCVLLEDTKKGYITKAQQMLISTGNDIKKQAEVSLKWVSNRCVSVSVSV